MGGRRRRLGRVGLLAAAGAVSLLLGVAVVPQAGAATAPPLGVPPQVGVSVPDLDRASQQLADGTGTRFGPVTTDTVSVRLAGESGSRSITLHRRYSVHGSPFLMLEHASPAVGPWAAPHDAAPVFLSYPVPDLDEAGQTLRRAGFELAAESDEFTIWRGVGGVLVRLLDADSAPAPSSPTAANDGLGPLRTVTFGPCVSDPLKQQLTQALGVSWKTRLVVPLPWQYADGHLGPKVHQVDATQVRSPHLTVETPDPAQPCAADHTPVHLVYFTADVAAAERRVTSAGMTFVGRAVPLTTYVRGAGGFYLEIGSDAFQLAELVP